VYRRTNKYAKRRKWHPRPAIAPEDQRPAEWRPPKLRRRLTIEDFDGVDPHVHVIEMFRSNRVDSYRVVVDGRDWTPRGQKTVGWSRILDWARKAMPRLASPRHAAY
jgi:hypothetical protein